MSNQYIDTIISKEGSAAYSHPLISSIKKIKGRHLPVKTMKVSAGADQKRSGGKVQHNAIDISIPVGTPVYAIADAIVLSANQLPNSKAGIYKKHGGTSTGKCGSSVNIKVPHPGSPTGYTYVGYCHLSKVNPKLKKGMQIPGGTILGYSGGKPGAPGAGNTTGPHLHLTIRPGDDKWTSNSLSGKNEVYNTWFQGANSDGVDYGWTKVLAYGGFATAGILTTLLGWMIYKRKGF